jgi:hypothetical protein
MPPPWQEGVRNSPSETPRPAAAAPRLERKAEESERILRDAAGSGGARGTAAPGSAADRFREDRGKAGLDAAEAVRILKDKKDAAPVVRGIERVGGRVFTWDGVRWVDQASVEGGGAKLKRVAIKAFSDAWIELAGRDKSIREALALGERVDLRVGDVVYTIDP